ncbi:NlpC/P60 family protein [Paenibacillus sp. RC67]|uniref:NlpC/P60 family protein n=1 Tax=Paenibacillus sp. RC67 TaxID=3039392 RepID=UPI0032C20F1B
MAHPGDLIFFKNIYRYGVSHVGIVTEPGRFIGLQTREGCEEHTYLKGYWRRKFMQIRRVLNHGKVIQVKKKTNKTQPIIVNVYTVITTDNKISDERIKQDLKQASEIWSVCGISFRLKKIVRLSSKQFKFKDGEFHSGLFLNKQPLKVQKLIRFNPPGCTRNDVVVIYMDSQSFWDEGAKRVTTGGIFFYKLDQGPRTATIVLASNSKERSQMLAHELGHALFVDPATGLAINPSPTRDRKERSHDRNRKNLMYPKPPKKPILNQRQCLKARKSILIKLS